MSSPASRKVVFAAIAANIAIAVCKYVAAAVTGSPAMLSEAFHSTADTGNELLLLFGMTRSRRPQFWIERTHPENGCRREGVTPGRLALPAQ